MDDNTDEEKGVMSQEDGVGRATYSAGSTGSTESSRYNSYDRSTVFVGVVDAAAMMHSNENGVSIGSTNDVQGGDRNDGPRKVYSIKDFDVIDPTSARFSRTSYSTTDSLDEAYKDAIDSSTHSQQAAKINQSQDKIDTQFRTVQDGHVEQQIRDESLPDVPSQTNNVPFISTSSAMSTIENNSKNAALTLVSTSPVDRSIPQSSTQQSPRQQSSLSLSPPPKTPPPTKGNSSGITSPSKGWQDFWTFRIKSVASPVSKSKPETKDLNLSATGSSRFKDDLVEDTIANNDDEHDQNAAINVQNKSMLESSSSNASDLKQSSNDQASHESSSSSMEPVLNQQPLEPSKSTTPAAPSFSKKSWKKRKKEESTTDSLGERSSFSPQSFSPLDASKLSPTTSVRKTVTFDLAGSDISTSYRETAVSEMTEADYFDEDALPDESFEEDEIYRNSSAATASTDATKATHLSLISEITPIKPPVPPAQVSFVASETSWNEKLVAKLSTTDSTSSSNVSKGSTNFSASTSSSLKWVNKWNEKLVANNQLGGTRDFSKDANDSSTTASSSSPLNNSASDPGAYRMSSQSTSKLTSAIRTKTAKYAPKKEGDKSSNEVSSNQQVNGQSHESIEKTSSALSNHLSKKSKSASTKQSADKPSNGELSGTENQLSNDTSVQAQSDPPIQPSRPLSGTFENFQSRERLAVSFTDANEFLNEMMVRSARDVGLGIVDSKDVKDLKIVEERISIDSNDNDNSGITHSSGDTRSTGHSNNSKRVVFQQQQQLQQNDALFGAPSVRGAFAVSSKSIATSSQRDSESNSKSSGYVTPRSSSTNRDSKASKISSGSGMPRSIDESIESNFSALTSTRTIQFESEDAIRYYFNTIASTRSPTQFSGHSGLSDPYNYNNQPTYDNRITTGGTVIIPEAYLVEETSLFQRSEQRSQSSNVRNRDSQESHPSNYSGVSSAGDSSPSHRRTRYGRRRHRHEQGRNGGTLARFTFFRNTRQTRPNRDPTIIYEAEIVPQNKPLFKQRRTWVVLSVVAIIFVVMAALLIDANKLDENYEGSGVDNSHGNEHESGNGGTNMPSTNASNDYLVNITQEETDTLFEVGSDFNTATETQSCLSNMKKHTQVLELQGFEDTQNQEVAIDGRDAVVVSNNGLVMFYEKRISNDTGEVILHGTNGSRSEQWQRSKIFFNSYINATQASVSISGNTAVVGYPHANTNGGKQAGTIAIYEFKVSAGDGEWKEVETTFSLQENIGENDVGVTAMSMFGWAVDVEEDLILVGAPLEGGGVGAIFLLHRQDENWTVVTSSIPSFNSSLCGEGIFFGVDVALQGNLIMASALCMNSIFVYSYNETTNALELLQDPFVVGSNQSESSWVTAENLTSSEEEHFLPPDQGFHCGCPSTCTETILNRSVIDYYGSYTCKDRISMLQNLIVASDPEEKACAAVSSMEFLEGDCGYECNPLVCNSEYLTSLVSWWNGNVRRKSQTVLGTNSRGETYFVHSTLNAEVFIYRKQHQAQSEPIQSAESKLRDHFSPREYISVPNDEDDKSFGHSIALDNNTLAVSGQNRVYIFRETESGNWHEEFRLETIVSDVKESETVTVALSNGTLYVGTRRKVLVYDLKECKYW